MAYYYGAQGDAYFNPDTCNVTYAHLTASVAGDYGSNNGTEIYIGDTVNPIQVGGWVGGWLAG